MRAVLVVRLPAGAGPDVLEQTVRAVRDAVPAGCQAGVAIGETADRILAEIPGLEVD